MEKIYWVQSTSNQMRAAEVSNLTIPTSPINIFNLDNPDLNVPSGIGINCVAKATPKPVLVGIINVTLNKNGAANVRIIKITASQKAGLVDDPYLFNVKEKTHIKMESTETIIPDRSEKLLLTCLLEPTFSPERFMKTLSITHDGNILWTHNYVLGPRSGGTIPLIAAGVGLSAELFQIRQLYHMVDSTTCWPREECETRPLAFRPAMIAA